MCKVCTIIKATVYLLMHQKLYELKPRHPEMKDYTLCLGNISKDFTINNMKK